MSEANKKAILETLKSIGRGIWFGLLGLIVTGLTALATNGFGETVGVTLLGQYVDITPFLILVFGLLAKALDRYVYANKNINTNGIAPNFLQR